MSLHLNQDGKIRYILKVNIDNQKKVCYSLILVTDSDDEKVMLNNLTDDKNIGIAFCDFLNRNQISPVHFETVFEDYFYC